VLHTGRLRIRNENSSGILSWMHLASKLVLLRDRRLRLTCWKIPKTLHKRQICALFYSEQPRLES
jgi:hypothetical protein